MKQAPEGCQVRKAMLDHKASADQLGQQVLRVQQACLDLSAQWALLVLAAQTAWPDRWVRPGLQASGELQALLERQARTARLVRRGVPASAARQGLRVL